MNSRACAALSRRATLLVSLLLSAGLAVTTAGEWSPLPEINERGGHVGYTLALGLTDEPYSTAHVTGAVNAVIPVFTPVVQIELGARYRGYMHPGWTCGPAPASALSYIDLRGYTGTDRRAHGASVSAAIAARLPFEFYVPMSAGGGAYFDAGRVAGDAVGLVRPAADGAAVVGGFVEHRLLAPPGDSPRSADHPRPRTTDRSLVEDQRACG